MQKTKRPLSLLLAVLMIVSMFAAVPFTASASDPVYVKVTEDQDDWSGTYLIVYEDESKAFNGSANLNYTMNYIGVTISDGEIESDASTDAAKVTIEQFEDGYSIKTTDGTYIGGSSNANSVESSSDAILNVISFADDSACIESNDRVLRFNTSWDGFRYYKRGQQPIQLYKLTGAAASNPDQEAADEVIALINAIGTVEYTDACKAKIDDARAAYDALTDTQKELVSNYTTLTDAETAYDELETIALTVWDGTIPTSAPSGYDETADPITLDTVDEFVWFFKRVGAGTSFNGKTVVLTTDIDLSGYNFGTVWTTPGNYFSGIFDGQNHTVSNFTFSSGNKAYRWSLFRNVKNATIKNLQLDNVNVGTGTGTGHAALVGMTQGDVTIENVHIGSGSVSGATAVGGVVGQNKAAELTIRNCSNAASITATTQYAGGIVGASTSDSNENTAILVENCVNTGAVTTASGGAAGIYGAIEPDTATPSVVFKDCANEGTLTATNGVTGEIYTSSTVSVTVKTTASDAVIALISAIDDPVVYTDECKAKIDAAREAYNALTIDQKDYVSNYSTLTAAEAAYAALEIAASVASVTVGGSTTYYDTFADALTAWTDGSTLKLMADVTYNSAITVPANTSKTLDLNGKTLSSDTTMIAEGTLTVQSSTAGGNIIHTAKSQVISARNGGTVTVNSGTITGYNADRAVIGGTGTFNLNGGKVVTPASNAFSIQEGSTLNLNAGEIECTSGSTSMGTASAVLAHGNTTINWVGTAIRTNTGNAITIKSAGTGTVSVFGGSFTATNSNPPANGGYAVYNDSNTGTLNLKGNPDFTGKGIYLANDKIINITGELSNTTPICVTMATPGVFTAGLSGNGSKDNFANGNDGYVVMLNDADEAMLYSADQLAADAVIALIDEIGTVEYTDECNEKIDAARAAYDALTATQKELVTNSATLTAAETEYAALEAAATAAAALVTAKTNAKAELDSYKNADDYRDAQKTELANAIAAGKDAIDAAADTAAVAEALANAKTAIDAIKTDAELTAEEAANTVRIGSVDDWNSFAESVKNGNTYSGKTVLLTADVGPVTTMVEGTFSGTFDGDGYTLTVDISGGTVATFQNAANAVFQNFTLAGSVTGSGIHTGALVKSITGGTCSFKNVIVSANVNGAKGYVGGFVAHAGNGFTVSFKNCLYSGSINHTGTQGNFIGAFIGWSQNCTATIENCAFTGSYSNTKSFNNIGFSYNAPRSVTVSDFYSNASEVFVANVNRGTRLYTPGSYTSVEGLVINGDEWTFFTQYSDALSAAQSGGTLLMLDKAVTDAEALINAIGEVAYDDACKAKIDEARAAYDALTAEQQALVTNIGTLTDAETEYAALEAAAALAQAKTDAKDALETYKDLGDYREAQQNAVILEVTLGKSAIDAATTIADVNTALANAKTAIDAIKTDAQLTAEELATAKTDAKDALDNYVNADDYRAAQQTELANAIANGKDAIDNAADTDAVATALANAKVAIDAIKTDAQMTAEEEAAAAIDQAKNMLSNALDVAENLEGILQNGNYTEIAETLQTAINAAQQALNSDDATVETLNAARETIMAATTAALNAKNAADAAQYGQDWQSVTIDDQISINFILNAANHTGLQSITIHYVNQDKEVTNTVYVDVNELVPVGDSYKVTAEVAPAQIGDTITITIVDANGTTEYSTSIAKYCRYLIENSDDADVVALAKATLEYGEAAREYFEYGSTFADTEKAQAAINTVKQEVTPTLSVHANGKITGVSFVALTKPEFRFYTSLTEEEAIELNKKINVTTGNAKAQFVRNVDTGAIMLEVTGIEAANMNQKVKITIGDWTIEFCGNDFAWLLVQDSTTAVLGAALYNYGLAAQDCFPAKEG